MPYTGYVAKRFGLQGTLSKQKIQTTNALLAKADVIVFMNHDVYRDAALEYTVNPHKCVIWDVEDVGVQRALAPRATDNEIALTTFAYIKKNVDHLLQELTETSWADIVNDQNEPLGFRLPISWIGNKGLWRRGCHLVLQTTDGRFLVEKRAHTIIFSPNRLDITLGGGVDGGESPQEAVIRETQEELGISLKPSALRLIDVCKWNTYHPHFQKYTRCFLYTYAAMIDSEQAQLRIQTNEVAGARLLTKRQVASLLRTHRLANFGRLSSGHAYYARVVKLAS